jgi:hypothetical protein
MPSANDHFNILLLIARPAAGKSEIIAHLKTTPPDQRQERFHIADFHELDDFPMLWTWFEEDSILAELGHPRIHTDSDSNFLHTYFWDLLIRRKNLEYEKILRDNSAFHQDHTLIIEFARGKSQGGFQRAFHHLSLKIAQKLAILYVNVSWEESLRKNRARYNPDRPDSILEHGLSDKKMELLYRDSDWDSLTKKHPGTIPIQGIQVPYAVLENEDDVTTRGGAALAQRLEESLQPLFKEYRDRN